MLPAAKSHTPCFVLGAVGVAVEVPHARPSCASSSSLTRKNARLRVVAAEAQVLVEAPGLLPVQVDVEQLARLERLRHAVREVEPRHLLVRHLGIDAHHLRVVERVDEGEHVADGRQEDVAARLVGLGLERELAGRTPASATYSHRKFSASRNQPSAVRGSLAALVSTPSRPPQKTYVSAPSSTPRSMARHRLLEGVARAPARRCW